MLIDTHSHIHEATFELKGDNATRALWLRSNSPDPNEMIARAAENGVKKIICVGTTVEDSKLAVDFVQNREACWASIGLHPHDAKTGSASDLEKLIDHPKVIAIGECGLDYYYSHSPVDAQVEMLRTQIELALKHKLPLIFHVRDAFDDFWQVFDSYSGLTGVVHSFTDSVKNLDMALERGLYIGVNGIATFTKSEDQKAMYSKIPLDRLLLETDSPFLTPVPHRGKVNEPAFLTHVAKFLADLRNDSLGELSAAASSNATTLFKLQ